MVIPLEQNQVIHVYVHNITMTMVLIQIAINVITVVIIVQKEMNVQHVSPLNIDKKVKQLVNVNVYQITTKVITNVPNVWIHA